MRVLFLFVACEGFGVAGGQSDLQDAMDGIEGLMQRFESLQPQLRSLARSEIETVASEGQQLHVRFLELQDRLGTVGAAGQSVVPAGEESRVIGFHRDLALFMARVESKLGITGPVPPSRSSLDGQGNGMPVNDNGQANSRISAAPFQSRKDAAASTDERLQATMQKVAEGMQRFEALHPHLRSVPPQVFNEIATRGQRLHEEFQALQRHGAELSGGGRTTSDIETTQYVTNFEAFAVEQAAFVRDAEAMVQNSMSAGVGRPTSAVGGLPSMSQPTSGGRVTPATDGRLNAVISKIVARMQEFEGLKMQFSRLPQQIFSTVAQRAQVLNDRFLALQQRGTMIAGDGSAPMLESDALSYAADMEAFHIDQAAFVDEAKQLVQSGGVGLAAAAAAGSGGRVAPLGSATPNSALSGGVGTALGTGLPPLSASPAFAPVGASPAVAPFGASPPLAPLGVAGFGSPSLGQPSGASGLRPLGPASGFGGAAGIPGAQFGANPSTMSAFGSPAGFGQGMLHAAR